MFLYAESPKQERNTLSHLTESIGLVFPNCTATFCSEDQFGVMEKRGVGRVTERKKKKKLKEKERGTKRG